MSRLVEVLVVCAAAAARVRRRDHGEFAGGGERFEHPSVGVEGLVGNQRIGGEERQEGIGTLQVMRLSRGQKEPGRIAERVDQGMNLGAQPASAAADRFVAAAFFLGAPALCWCARTIVLSIIAYSLSASALRCWKTFAHTPLRAQRVNRV